MAFESGIKVILVEAKGADYFGRSRDYGLVLIPLKVQRDYLSKTFESIKELELGQKLTVDCVSAEDKQYNTAYRRSKSQCLLKASRIHSVQPRNSDTELTNAGTQTSVVIHDVSVLISTYFGDMGVGIGFAFSEELGRIKLSDYETEGFRTLGLKPRSFATVSVISVSEKNADYYWIATEISPPKPKVEMVRFPSVIECECKKGTIYDRFGYIEHQRYGSMFFSFNDYQPKMPKKTSLGSYKINYSLHVLINHELKTETKFHCLIIPALYGYKADYRAILVETTRKGSSPSPQSFIVYESPKSIPPSGKSKKPPLNPNETVNKEPPTKRSNYFTVSWKKSEESLSEGKKLGSRRLVPVPGVSESSNGVSSSTEAIEDEKRTTKDSSTGNSWSDFFRNSTSNEVVPESTSSDQPYVALNNASSSKEKSTPRTNVQALFDKLNMRDSCPSTETQQSFTKSDKSPTPFSTQDSVTEDTAGVSKAELLMTKTGLIREPPSQPEDEQKEDLESEESEEDDWKMLEKELEELQLQEETEQCDAMKTPIIVSENKEENEAQVSDAVTMHGRPSSRQKSPAKTSPAPEEGVPGFDEMVESASQTEEMEEITLVQDMAKDSELLGLLFANKRGDLVAKLIQTLTKRK